MREPKYKLNKKDEARFNVLSVRHAFGTATAAEDRELDALQTKRRKKIHSHPKMIEADRREALAIRRINHLIRKCQKIVEELRK